MSFYIVSFALSLIIVQLCVNVHADGWAEMECTPYEQLNQLTEYHQLGRSGYWLNGQQSKASRWIWPFKQDREFSWRKCRPRGDPNPVATQVLLQRTLSDVEWVRGCENVNRGDAAFLGGESDFNDNTRDREWAFYCYSFKPRYELRNCEWTGYLNEFDRDLSYSCPYDGVIQRIQTTHDNNKEDRKWKFYCCRVWDKECEGCANAELEEGEELSYMVDMVDNNEENKNPADNGWYTLTTNQELLITCGVIASITLVLGCAVWYLHFKETQLVEFPMKKVVIIESSDNESQQLID